MEMLVVGSIATPKSERVYHKQGCIYEKRIQYKNRMVMSLGQAEENNYCECSYCSGLKGEVRVSQRQMKKWESKNGFSFTYAPNTDTLYINSGVGFWKIFMLDEYKNYVLYHRNVYSKEMNFEEAIHGSFHRQKDVKAKESIEEIINYIVAHDKAKVIMMDDYHKLPQRTKKQKKYYRQAENRARRQSIKRLDSIFLALENQNPSLKNAYREMAYC